MSSTSVPTVSITPTNTTASAAGATVSAGQTPQASSAQTTPLYTVYAKYDTDPRSFPVGTYLSYDDAKAGMQAQVINGADLKIFEMDVIDRTAG
jgi:hypothetical protein